MRLPNKIVFMFLLLIITLVYANSLKNPFYYDDFDYILQNEGVSSLSNFPALFQKAKYYQLFHSETYRPVTFASYLLLNPLFGEKPARWRTFNLFFHLVNCCLLYLLLKRYAVPDILSFAAAAIFAVHPAHTETLNVISFNTDILGGFFCLIAFFAYFKSGHLWRLLSLVSFCLAFWVKETFILLPLLALLFDWFASESPLDWRRLASRQVGYYLLCLLLLGINFYLMKKPPGVLPPRYPGGTVFSALATFTVVLVYYLKLFILPLKLTPIYDFPVSSSFFAWPVIAASLLLSLLGVLIIQGWRQKQLYAPLLAWFFLFLLPTSNLIPFWAILAERYLYIPFMGLIPGILLLAKYGLERLNVKWEKPLYTLSLVFLVFLGGLTVRRNQVWQNPEALWLDTLSKTHTPVIAQKPRLLLGAHYARQKDYRQAIAQYKLVAAINPNEPLVYKNLGNNYFKLGDYRLAKENYLKALERQKLFTRPGDYASTLFKLGATYQQLNDPETAQYFFELAAQNR